jgi:soluble lytic murein transglycosylase-like protein
VTDRPPGPRPGPTRALARARTFRRRRITVAISAALLVTALTTAFVAVIGGDADDDLPKPPATTVPAFVDGAAKRSLAPAFEAAARANDLPPALLMALGWRESRWRAEAYNPESGATGIGQLLPATATFVATELLGEPTLDPTNGRDNIRMMARYVRALTERFDGDTRLALAAYLQGSTSVADGGVSAQTEAYLADIEEIRQRFAAARRGDPGSADDPLAS